MTALDETYRKGEPDESLKYFRNSSLIVLPPLMAAAVSKPTPGSRCPIRKYREYIRAVFVT
jgi:hypothetical protein